MDPVGLPAISASQTPTPALDPMRLLGENPYNGVGVARSYRLDEVLNGKVKHADYYVPFETGDPELDKVISKSYAIANVGKKTVTGTLTATVKGGLFGSLTGFLASGFMSLWSGDLINRRWGDAAKVMIPLTLAGGALGVVIKNYQNIRQRWRELKMVSRSENAYLEFE